MNQPDGFGVPGREMGFRDSKGVVRHGTGSWILIWSDAKDPTVYIKASWVRQDFAAGSILAVG